MITLRKFILSLSLVLSLALSSGTRAAVFNFGISFDGTTASLDAGSTDPVGTSLSTGDSFVVDFHATNGNFWRVDAPYTQRFPLTFIVSDGGLRTGDVVSSFLLDGVEVESITDMSVLQQQIHVGAENWTLPVGLEFDTVQLSYELLSAAPIGVGGPNPVPTIIVDRPDIFGSLSDPERPFFRNPNISFNAVPEPATLGLALIGILGFAFIRRR